MISSSWLSESETASIVLRGDVSIIVMVGKFGVSLRYAMPVQIIAERSPMPMSPAYFDRAGML